MVTSVRERASAPGAAAADRERPVPNGARRAPGGTVSRALALQSAAGNGAVARVVTGAGRGAAPPVSADGLPAAGAARSSAAPSPAPAPARGPAPRPAVPVAAAPRRGPATAAGGAGGAAVARVAPVAVPAVPAARGGQAKLAALAKDVSAKQRKIASAPPGTVAAAAAQAAAVAPADDKVAHGKAVNAEKMHKAEPGEFDKAAFIAAVEQAIAAQAPKNLEDADDYAGSGKADTVQQQVSGQVQAGKAQSAAPIGAATAAPPDTAAVPDKQVTPLAEDAAPATPAPPDPSLAVPDKAPTAATDFSEGPRQVDQQMTGAAVTDEQLATSGEAEFTTALAAKQEGEAHAASAPGKVRATEATVLTATKAAAGKLGVSALAAMKGARVQAGKAVAGGQQQTRTADESRRAQVAARLQAVFDGTKKAVEEILSGLDTKVDEKFTAEEKAAREAFTAEHQRAMAEYKDKRYSGLDGAARWLSDKLFDMPAEAEALFAKARRGYVTRMKDVISSVADLIGSELGRARARIAEGRTELKAEVDKLPDELKALGKEKAGEFEQKFDELGESVKNKGQGLVQTLATKYTEAVGKVDEEIAAEKEKGKGLVSKAVSAVGGVIKTIMQLKDMLLGVLAKAASAVMAIIKDPIGFLGNLVSAVGAGLQAFLSNIVEHLKKGLFGWLLGAAGGMGLELPKTFDLRGILGMVASLMGLTWAAIEGRIVERALKLGIPQRAISAVEAGVTIVQKLRTQGLSGVIEEVKDKIGDLKDNLVGKLTEYLVPTVLKAGIIWIVSLLNPASAFVKACKAIIDFVSFVVERGAQIMEFVGSILDAVIAIAKGGGGGVPALVEKALARSVPVLIGALAALLGIGGIATKVKEFFQSLSKPVMSAVEWVVDKVVTAGKGIWARMKGAARKKGSPDAKDRARPDAVKDDAKSLEVKRLVAEDMKQRGPIETKDIPAVLSTTYRRHHPRGLKGIGIRVDRNDLQQVGVLVNASPTDEVAKLPVSKKGLAQALRWTREFDYMSGPTVLRISYDTDGKSFGAPIENQENMEHAEMVFKRLHLRPLKDRIVAERKAGKILTPSGSRVPVAFDLNRIPCPNCASIISLLNEDPEIRFVVRAANASNKVSAEVHVDYIEKMLAAGVEVSTLQVHEAVLKKIVEVLQGVKATSVKPLTGNEQDLLSVAIPRIRDNISKESVLAELIEAARARRQAAVALETVKPVGAGV